MRRRRRSAYELGLALLVLTALAGLPTLAQDFIVEVKNEGLRQDLQSKNTEQSSPESGVSGISLTVHAVNARLFSVAEEIQRQLKVTVRLSNLMHRQRVTVDFAALPLDRYAFPFVS